MILSDNKVKKKPKYLETPKSVYRQSLHLQGPLGSFRPIDLRLQLQGKMTKWINGVVFFNCYLFT